LNGSERAPTYATPQHTEESIEAVAGLERDAQDAMSHHQRWIENVTSRLGRPISVYFIMAFVSVWIAANEIL
jgi:uncharacterized membrane protein